MKMAACVMLDLAADDIVVHLELADGSYSWKWLSGHDLCYHWV